jgi:hypothetical protein
VNPAVGMVPETDFIEQSFLGLAQALSFR